MFKPLYNNSELLKKSKLKNKNDEKETRSIDNYRRNWHYSQNINIHTKETKIMEVWNDLDMSIFSFQRINTTQEWNCKNGDLDGQEYEQANTLGLCHLSRSQDTVKMTKKILTAYQSKIK